MNICFDQFPKAQYRSFVLYFLPFKVVITNLEAGKVIELDAKKWPDAQTDDTSALYKVSVIFVSIMFLEGCLIDEIQAKSSLFPLSRQPFAIYSFTLVSYCLRCLNNGVFVTSTQVPFSNVVYIERSDFRMKDSKDYYGLALGKSVLLR